MFSRENDNNSWVNMGSNGGRIIVYDCICIIIIIIIKIYYRLAVTHTRRQIWQLSKLQTLQ